MTTSIVPREIGKASEFFCDLWCHGFVRSFLHLVVSEKVHNSRDHFFLASRNTGEVANVNRTTSSPVTVLMSWCRLTTLMPVTSWTMRFQERPRRFDQMSPHLFEQVSALLGRQRLDQLLFGRRQDALEADHEKVTDQVGVDVLGPAAHVFLLEATSSLRRWRLRFLPAFSW